MSTHRVGDAQVADGLLVARWISARDRGGIILAESVLERPEQLESVPLCRAGMTGAVREGRRLLRSKPKQINSLCNATKSHLAKRYPPV
jgi:hypothetical protein